MIEQVDRLGRLDRPILHVANDIFGRMRRFQPEGGQTFPDRQHFLKGQPAGGFPSPFTRRASAGCARLWNRGYLT